MGDIGVLRSKVFYTMITVLYLCRYVKPATPGQKPT
jgi:hypothetical protein